jgi:colanic acid biosynthesis glycosyl transferase WcaI
MRFAIHDYAGHPFIFDLSRALARRGHQVGHFYFKGDKGPKGAVERLDDDPVTFSIHPVGIAGDYDKANLISRGLNDIAYGRALCVEIEQFKPDVILSANTPLAPQRLLLKTARRLNAGFVFWMQDFYSLAIKRLLQRRWMGLGWLISAYYLRLEERLLRESDHIVYISPDFQRTATQFFVGETSMSVIPNWASIDNIPLRDKQNAWASAHGLSNKFVFLYSGTLALKHNPSLLRALAERFSSHPDVVVVVTAYGVGLDELAADLAQKPSSAMLLFPLQPLDVLPDMLASADVLVALLEADAGAFSVPSKVLSYYCAGRPVLMSAPMDNLAARTTVESECGIVTAPDDDAGFLDAAELLFNNTTLRKNAGAKARSYAEATFHIETVADQFEAILQENANRHV